MCMDFNIISTLETRENKQLSWIQKFKEEMWRVFRAKMLDEKKHRNIETGGKIKYQSLSKGIMKKLIRHKILVTMFYSLFC